METDKLESLTAPRRVTPEAILSRAQHVTPGDAVAHVAGLLMTQPSTYIPALVKALRAVRGQGPAAAVAQHILKQVMK